MSNLSELLPAGSSVKSADFVAQGTLASGVTVGLRSDGKVEAIAGAVEAIGSSVTFESALSAGIGSTYDSNSNRVVIGYYDGGNSYYGTCVVGVVSGTSISFGTPVLFQSGYADPIVLTFDSSQNKVVITYLDATNSGRGTAIVGTVNGGTNSITFGTKVAFAAGSSPDIATTFDSANNKIVTIYRDTSTSNEGKAIVGTVSGTSISFGSIAAFGGSNSTVNFLGITFDSSNNKVACFYQDGNVSLYGRCEIGTVSGTSISFGSAVTFEASNTDPFEPCFDSTNNKVIISYQSTGGFLGVKVGTISGTSVSFGAETLVGTGSGGVNYAGSAYDSNAKKVVVSYRKDVVGAYGQLAVGTVSGTSITFATPIIFQTGNIAGLITSPIGVTFDSTNNKVITSYTYTGGGSVGNSVVFSNASTNVSSYVGITDQAISSAATGKVVCKGGAITNTGLLPYSLSFGSSAVFESTTAGYTATAYDSNNNKIVVGYSDSQGYGAVSIGTVSGSAISYATPVRYTAQGGTSYNTVVYDPTNQKVVAIYADSNNSNHGYAVVGTVSGTTTSWGSPVVFTANNSRYYSAAFDSNAGKIVIAYQNQANTYGQAIVGTVSGTSISFGTAVTFEAASARYVNIGFDSNVNKVVIAYRDDGNSGYGTSIVGTVSGTSISFGSAVIFESAESADYNVVFDSNANKVVIAFSDVGNAYKGTAIVGTVSGTSISFGSASIFNSGTIATGISASFDSAQNKVIVGYLITSDGEAVVGTVSGTSISFDTPVEFSDGTLTYVSSVYDANSSATVFNYMDSTGSNDGTGIVGSLANDLTPNTAYFVQDDGTISTTSSTTKAGTALSTTSLLLTG